jgi:hypothetical protein
MQLRVQPPLAACGPAATPTDCQAAYLCTAIKRLPPACHSVVPVPVCAPCLPLQSAALRAARHAYSLSALTALKDGAAGQDGLAAASWPLLSSPSAAAAGPPEALAVQRMSWRRVSLPLARPLTTASSRPAPPSSSAAGAAPGSSISSTSSSSSSSVAAGYGHRDVLLLRLELGREGGYGSSAHEAASSGHDGSDAAIASQLAAAAVGVGEVAPLPGLHRETLAEAEQQVRVCACVGEGARRAVGLLVQCACTVMGAAAVGA